MKKSEIIRILSGLNIPTTGETGFIHIPNLKSLNLTSDGNHVIDAHGDYINFDFNNELIKIKEYAVEGISAMFNLSYGSIDKNIINTTLPPIKHNLYPFRKYAIGDIVYYVDRKTLKRNVSLDSIIINIDDKGVHLDKYIPTNYNDYYICYAAGNSFATSVLDEEDNRLALIYKARTKFNTDIYLSFESICGFVFKSGLSTLI
jgi:hypothetical protein